MRSSSQTYARRKRTVKQITDGAAVNVYISKIAIKNLDKIVNYFQCHQLVIVLIAKDNKVETGVPVEKTIQVEKEKASGSLESQENI